MPFNSLRMPQLRSGRIKSMKILFKNNHLSVENPRVTGSIPVSATNKIKLTAMWAFFMSVGLGNYLQGFTVLTILNVRNLLVRIRHADLPWMILANRSY